MEYYITSSKDPDKTAQVEALNRAVGSYRSTYHGVDGNISGRDGFSRRDWDSQRGGQPTKHSDIMLKATRVYYDCSLIRNIIDLMADFTGQGMRISHPVKSTERFYRAWYKRIGGEFITERFANYLYRYSNVIISKSYGTLSRSAIRNMSKAAGPIPAGYTFLNPAIVDLENGDISCFLKDKKYIITIPSSYNSKLGSDQISKGLDPNIKKAITQGKPIALDSETTLVFHYRKDDWSPWAKPILYSVFRDIDMLDMLELADRTALDGAITNIRLFKLGNVAKDLIPTEALFSRLDDMLQSHTPGGTIDLIWDEAIEMEESKTEVHKFLGKDKYIPHLEKIYQGLGIPTTLAGSSNTAGSTNNFISLKTLLQRLEHGRNILTAFWENELAEVQKALGFAKAPVVEFDFSNLTDDVAYKALLIQLADRNLISDELLQSAFNNNSELEKKRINREEKERDAGRRARKPGPYNEGDFEKLVLRDAITNGLIDPSKTGIETIDNMKMKQVKAPDKMEGPPGRPKNSKDKKKRQRLRFNPIGTLDTKIAAKTAFAAITDFLKPLVLKVYKKYSIRDLTQAEYAEYDSLRISMFFALKDPSNTSDAELSPLVGVKVNKEYLNRLNDLLASTSKKIKRELTQDEKIDIYSIIYNENLHSRK